MSVVSVPSRASFSFRFWSLRSDKIKSGIESLDGFSRRSALLGSSRSASEPVCSRDSYLRFTLRSTRASNSKGILLSCSSGSNNFTHYKGLVVAFWENKTQPLRDDNSFLLART